MRFPVECRDEQIFRGDRKWHDGSAAFVRRIEAQHELPTRLGPASFVVAENDPAGDERKAGECGSGFT